METIIDIGTIAVWRSQQVLWRDGRLMPEWAQRFPELFDEQDVRTAEDQPQYHFVEWLAAIVLHHATGFLALVEKYAYANHPRKQRSSQSCFLTMCCGFSATRLSMVPFRVLIS